jgi:hypothetical protein
MKRLSNIQVILTALCTPILFLILSTFNMLIYRGGHATEYMEVPYHFEDYIPNYDPTDLRYSFSLNYFSDMGALWTFDGRSNLLSSIIFCCTLTSFGIMMIPYFKRLPSFFEADSKGKKVVTVASKIALVAAWAYVGIGWTPWNVHPVVGTIHSIFNALGFLLVIPIGILIAIGIIRTEKYPNVYAGVSIFLALSMIAYVGSNFFAPPYETEPGLIFNVLGQKAIIYTLTVCIFLQTLGTYHYLVKRCEIPRLKTLIPR